MDEKHATEIEWALWAGGTLGSFAALETRALLTGRRTLTQQVRVWLGLDPVCPWRYYACGPFVITVFYLVLHFLTGKFNIRFLIPKSRR